MIINEIVKKLISSSDGHGSYLCPTKASSATVPNLTMLLTASYCFALAMDKLNQALCYDFT
jgi:hypothetical protein